MEVTTIVGIVVAVIIILVGLRMVLRKPNDAAPSLESELHINEECNQPVIPRHVRDQLQADRLPEDKARVEPSLNALDAVEVAEEKSQQLSVEAVEKGETKLEHSSLSHLGKTEEQTESAETVVTSTEHVQDAAVSSTDLLTDTDTQSSENEQSSVVAEESKPVDKVEAFQLKEHVETAEIKEFDEESSILDVHLNQQQRHDDECVLSNAESIIALNVYPNPRKALSGDKTLKVLLKYGLRFGELMCFHRYENPEEESPLLFSVLRVTDNGPEGFDLESLSTEQVQGLAFFLALPHPNVQKGFDTMVSIAGLIAREIDGTVYDENNLEFTPQLKEHWRHTAIDYRSGQEA
ncbi:cell division protein ZipA C-terminal FtsZ-binding domain-containing protein [Acinetobacter sp. P8-3-8]|uniref:cell division protein ZipA C-terminal FtsZ-binding domain-containing protein n=1 Tax=Acinetobacter sp. P8-3-8 TaxID=1029823 RepID=UPI0002485D87|nr:cell division protein ZipA C-terminal FtsZ-binding domain-containing protein [Acinetobacter sp. P8-3-8]